MSDEDLAVLRAIVVAWRDRFPRIGYTPIHPDRVLALCAEVERARASDRRPADVEAPK